MTSYAYLDSEVVSDDSDPRNEGRTVVDTPKHSFSMLSRYTFENGNFLNGTTLGAGVTYSGVMFPESRFNRRFAQTDKNTIANLFISKAFSLNNGSEIFTQVNFDNIFDEKGISRAHMWVEPQEVKFTVRYSY